MFIRRLYIKFKIWRIQSQINNIIPEINLFYVGLVSLNAKYDNKLDIEKMLTTFVTKQEEKKRYLLNELKSLKNILDNL